MCFDITPLGILNKRCILDENIVFYKYLVEKVTETGVDLIPPYYPHNFYNEDGPLTYTPNKLYTLSTKHEQEFDYSFKQLLIYNQTMFNEGFHFKVFQGDPGQTVENLPKWFRSAKTMAGKNVVPYEVIIPATAKVIVGGWEGVTNQIIIGRRLLS